jgi:hypothetical protein
MTAWGCFGACARDSGADSDRSRGTGASNLDAPKAVPKEAQDMCKPVAERAEISVAPHDCKPQGSTSALTTDPESSKPLNASERDVVTSITGALSDDKRAGEDGDASAPEQPSDPANRSSPACFTHSLKLLHDNTLSKQNIQLCRATELVSDFKDLSFIGNGSFAAVFKGEPGAGRGSAGALGPPHARSPAVGAGRRELLLRPRARARASESSCAGRR